MNETSHHTSRYRKLYDHVLKIPEIKEKLDKILGNYNYEMTHNLFTILRLEAIAMRPKLATTEEN